MMITFLLHFHSGLRWALLLGILVALVRYALVWRASRDFATFDTTLATVVTALFDVQLLAGIAVLYGMSAGFTYFPRYMLEHASTMLLAVVAMHAPARWKRSPGPVRAKAFLFSLAIALFLVLVGISRLPQGWQ
jgi:hypothetical protein